MKTFITIAALAFLAITPAQAANPVENPDYFCTPMTGNWLNAATMHCSPLGNGGNARPVSVVETPEPPPSHECPKEPKGDEGGETQDGNETY